MDADCRSSVEGLYAVGDAATRELIAGATSGGGAQNAAWALTSGRIAGQAAARAALPRKNRATPHGRPTGGAGLRPTAHVRSIDFSPVIPAFQASTIDFDGALWRSEAKLSTAQAVLDTLWKDIAGHAHATGIGRIAMREQAAMIAAARWVGASALTRTESRGMHMRVDRPDLDHRFASRVLAGGLDRVWTRLETPAARSPATKAVA